MPRPAFITSRFLTIGWRGRERIVGCTKELSVTMLDLYNLETINDVFNQLRGDEFVKAMSRILEYGM
jgi:GGDEF domain-containing protein